MATLNAKIKTKTGNSTSYKINSKRDLLMVKLTEFYSHKKNIDRLLPIIVKAKAEEEKKNHVSLRVIDWFVTNYSKKYDVKYKLRSPVNNKIVLFSVYSDYKAQLKSYSKKEFDPFRRSERIWFFFDEKNEIETTVGQLNFFRWCIENKILDYIEKNLEAVEKDMNESTKCYKKRRNKKNTKSVNNDSKDTTSIKKTKTAEGITMEITTQDMTQGKKIVVVDKDESQEITGQRKPRQPLSISAREKPSKRYFKLVVDFN